jgi:hypothetical protein
MINVKPTYRRPKSIFAVTASRPLWTGRFLGLISII